MYRISFYKCVYDNNIGRSFTLASPNLTDIGDPAIKGGNPGIYTKESGFLSFFEVCFFSQFFFWSMNKFHFYSSS